MAERKFYSGLPPRSKKSAAESPATGGERLQKILAAAGIGSRRKCEDLIREGRVEIDGRVVTELGVKVDPEKQHIIVDGVPLKTQTQRVHYLVNKPTNVVSTNHDPDGRTRVIDLVPEGDHLYTIGRLDLYSEGLILVTNDGELTNRLAHPRYGIEKTYLALVAGDPDNKILERLKSGVHLAEGIAQCKEVRVKARPGNNTLLEIVLDEGRNREIRRVLARVGHKVLKLQRTAIGPLKLGDLKPGGWRTLTDAEVAKLLELAKPRPTKAKRKPKKAKKSKPLGRVRSVTDPRSKVGRAPRRPALPE